MASIGMAYTGAASFSFLIVFFFFFKVFYKLYNCTALIQLWWVLLFPFQSFATVLHGLMYRISYSEMVLFIILS